MNILILDPASSTGYCLVEIKDKKANIFKYGHIDIAPSDYDGDRCVQLMNEVKSLITEHNVKHVGIEDFFFSSRNATGSMLNAFYRAAIYTQCRLLGLGYTIINVSNWKKFIAGRSTPTKEQKLKWGKEPAKKLMIQQALWDKFKFRFPDYSISLKTGKPIKFRYDVVDAVGQAIFYCFIHENINEVELSVSVDNSLNDSNKIKKAFIYPEE